MDTLRRLEIRGYRSIRDASLELGSLNILIGANGAGKSNLLSFLGMLGWLSSGSFQRYVNEQIGSANDLLFYGARRTPIMEAELQIERPSVSGPTEVGTNTYFVRLGHAAGDTLIFLDETVRYEAPTHGSGPYSLGAGHRESALKVAADEGTKPAKAVLFALQRFKAFHFHDTSRLARIRNACLLDDDAYLRSDAGNLPAYLYSLREGNKAVYERIRETIRQIAPFFDDFLLEPGGERRDMVRLRWKGTTSDFVFGPQHLSDGTLRAMALVTLLLRPEDELPWLIALDEPELGLHPYALTILAGLLQQASTKVQVVVSTQSTALVDQFEPEQVVVVDQSKGESTFRRLDPGPLEQWLEDYSLGDLWNKNLLGGRPTS